MIYLNDINRNMSLKSINKYILARAKEEDKKISLDYHSNYCLWLIATQQTLKDFKPYVEMIQDIKNNKNIKDKSQEEIKNEITKLLKQ